jgi:hypothetical protein
MVSAHASRRSTPGLAKRQSASFSQNLPCCQARATTFLVALPPDGFVGWPSGGS